MFGWPLVFAAFLLSIVVIAKGRVAAGLLQLASTVFLSPFVYLSGLYLMAFLIAPKNPNQSTPVTTPAQALRSPSTTPPLPRTTPPQPSTPATQPLTTPSRPRQANPQRKPPTKKKTPTSSNRP